MDELHSKLESIQQESHSPTLGSISRNLICQQNVVQQVSTDQQTLFVQELDLFKKQAKIKKSFSKVPSMADLTFFDLSNPTHLNKLFSKLEELQNQETVERLEAPTP